MKTYLVTGGAGFVGSHLAIRLKRDRPDCRVIALDNLRRRGSELNLPRLSAGGVEFRHGDVRVRADLDVAERIDDIIDCAAEPSVLAGYQDSPDYVIGANLAGTVNCLELARRHEADFIMFSTSRVYPYRLINDLEVIERETRYELTDRQLLAGASAAGINEEFPLVGARSLYGATKLASELLLQEYIEMYGLRGVVNRCGVLSGPWQMAKVDQGFVALWVARHLFGRPLAYIGFDGTGKQVRDVLHIDDLCRLVDFELTHIDALNGTTLNVGGGPAGSVSLRELTVLCQDVTGRRVEVCPEPTGRAADARVYVSDFGKVHKLTGWTPTIGVAAVVEDITRWIQDNERAFAPLL